MIDSDFVTGRLLKPSRPGRASQIPLHQGHSVDPWRRGRLAPEPVGVATRLAKRRGRTTDRQDWARSRRERRREVPSAVHSFILALHRAQSVASCALPESLTSASPITTFRRGHRWRWGAAAKNDVPARGETIFESNTPRPRAGASEALPRAMWPIARTRTASPVDRIHSCNSRPSQARSLARALPGGMEIALEDYSSVCNRAWHCPRYLSYSQRWRTPCSQAAKARQASLAQFGRTQERAVARSSKTRVRSACVRTFPKATTVTRCYCVPTTRATGATCRPRIPAVQAIAAQDQPRLATRARRSDVRDSMPCLASAASGGPLVYHHRSLRLSQGVRGAQTDSWSRSARSLAACPREMVDTLSNLRPRKSNRTWQ